MDPESTRCDWARSGHAAMRAYHDHEWGVPLHDDQRLFEFLCLEGVQAGLSWRTVLDKRAHYRKRFHDFAIERVAAMSDTELQDCLTDAGLIRNRRKMLALRANAQAAQAAIGRWGSLDAWLWSFVGGAPIIHQWQEPAQVPAATPRSQRMSRELHAQGFRFVGPTICYAFMQATGMVNDHLLSCFRHAPCAALARQSPQTSQGCSNPITNASHDR